MAIWLDGNFWSHYFDEIFIPRINAFCEVIINRVLPTFANIEREAEQVAQAEYERLGSLRAVDDSYVDLADIAEEAEEASIVY